MKIPVNVALRRISGRGAACCAPVGSISPIARTKLVILSAAKDLNQPIATLQNRGRILESRTAA